MKSTLADIKQLFNVKDIAYSTNINALAEGQIAIFEEGNDVSVASGTTFSTLPDKVRIVSKLNGKIYYSFDTIEKARIFNQKASDYTGEQINIWEGLVEHCNCIDGVQLNLNIEEQSLIQRDGLTWTHNDFVVIVSPQELQCYCSCDGSKPAFENNILTKLLAEKINANASAFYEAEVKVDITSVAVYATQFALDAGIPAPVQGEMAIVTAEGLKVYDGAAWVVVGTILGVLTDIDALIAVFKDVNVDANLTNDGVYFTLVIKGKLQGGKIYRDLDVNYVYPRGVRLNPVLKINGGDKTIEFTQTQALAYEVGAGYDLRAEEFESMSLYTNLNFYPRLSDGIASNDLVYQFENSTDYKTLTFEFGSKKSGLEDVPEGDYKKFMILFGVEDDTLWSELVDMFIA